MQTSLAGNELTGTLPDSIAAWTSLTQFVAFGNHFTGTLSPSFGEGWQSIKVFGLDRGYDDNFNIILGNNNMNGTLPETLSSWTDLQVRLLGAGD